MPYVAKDKVANILLIILFRRTLTQNTLFPDLTDGERSAFGRIETRLWRAITQALRA